MTTDTLISLDTARLMLLTTQVLLHPPAQPAQKEDVMDAICRMGALQIDTIHVVARSPYMVLFSRLGHYDPRWLEELEAEGRLFEYWSHAACFLPIEDYPLYRSRMLHLVERYYTNAWCKDNQETIDLVMRKILEEGPVRSADFERKDGRKGSWWDWKVEKQALEYLHTNGHLMIVQRKNFQRIYDLRERVMPDWDEARALSLEEAEDALAVRTVKILGATPARWVTDYFRIRKQGSGIAKRLERLAEAGQIDRVAVDGWKDPWYIHPENHSLMESVLKGAVEPTYTTLLSPFDPLVWDRERARVLFNFDFSLECYLPELKRKYGYYLLPILHRGRLVGRLDAKSYRKEGIFEVRALYLEAETRLTEELASEVLQAIQRCAEWHGTPRVEIRKCEPEVFKEMLKV